MGSAVKLWIASDHAGVLLKKHIVQKFESFSSEAWIDLGAFSEESVDYPSFADSLCEQVLKHSSSEELLLPRGILLCGSGVGMSIRANRYTGIRAVLAESEQVARLSREHNASNVLCLGARVLDANVAERVVGAWLSSTFAGGRHQRRVEMLDQAIHRK